MNGVVVATVRHTGWVKPRTTEMSILIPMGFKDVITTRATIYLPFWERLKIFLGFQLELNISHYTKEQPVQVITKVHAAAGYHYGPWMPQEIETLCNRPITTEMVDKFYIS
jgi:hypothetical protein